MVSYPPPEKPQCNALRLFHPYTENPTCKSKYGRRNNLPPGLFLHPPALIIILILITYRYKPRAEKIPSEYGGAMKRYQKYILAAILTVLILALTGCRTRVLTSPDSADNIRSVPSGESAVTDDTEPELPLTSTQSRESTPLKPPQDSVSDNSTGGYGGAAGTGITVTYDPNGGDGDAVVAIVHLGQAYGVQPSISRRGYTLNGFWTKAVGGERITPETTVTNADEHTLYAHWKSKTACTVRFDPNGGRIKSAQAERTLGEGDAFGQMPIPVREGYSFDGWFTERDGGSQIRESDLFDGSPTLTLYAHWTYDPFAYWSFTLENKTQQLYLCQQSAIYFETETDHVTQINCPLITSTGSQNIAANRDDANVTDDWVKAKRPAVVIKCVSSAGKAQTEAAAVAARFPEQKIIVVTRQAVSGDEASILYARLALAKKLYPDWYTDVDLAVVAQELGTSSGLIYFYN